MTRDSDGAYGAGEPLDIGEADEAGETGEADRPAGGESSAAEEGQALSALSYEQARGELLRVVQRLEAGGATLEESLALWERGEELARVCREWLAGARARLDAVLEEEAEAEAEAEAGSGDGMEEGVEQARARRTGG
jgi:exodeoxyribonuclease VII small subunit